MADLFGTYSKRMKLTINRIKIDADLSWFPVTVFLDSTHGNCVFDELGGNLRKIALTKADGETELYGELERWDNANELAFIHASRDGWTISSSVDTDLFLYYDNGADNNDDFISGINDGVPGESVWDASFTAVWHMREDAVNRPRDSTNNSNDGTKKSANEPLQVYAPTAKIGGAQDFDGLDDYIGVGAHADVNPGIGSFTSEVVIKTDKQTSELILDNREGGFGEGWMMSVATSPAHKTRFSIEDHGAVNPIIYGDTTIDDDIYKYIVGLRDVPEDELRLFVNAVSDAVAVTDTTTQTVNSATDLKIGIIVTEDAAPFQGYIDEIRLSQVRRTDAWIKATYNSLWNTLLTYGSEESATRRSSFFLMFPNF